VSSRDWALTAPHLSVLNDDEHRADAVGSLLLSVAFLEAHINEFLSNVQEPNAGGLEVLPLARYRALLKVDESVDRKSILEKYQWVLGVADASPFDPGANPYQDVALAIDFRNALVHFRPSWQEYGADELRLAEALRPRFRNPLLPGPQLFPQFALCFDSAAWAARAAFEFVEEFNRRLGGIAAVGPPGFLRRRIVALQQDPGGGVP